ncbi:50S ribosomal protein L25/general stress protein Ctc [Tessaracoccus rhinocerotis]|uniref:Large ribosomal subunit protein bL25 n=1 Tax=Tessaracoccus rhinocerotis TaxID=1689449 RepID=A0A553K1U6_9ACTN|nr:50S ribosomal protein L25/general stress protein Ctc [Tessaracoccus rhinocerotis]TRY18678.1 50S ribosomal protein L25/general stress protein Ctc [Tessaracoccus rhinocerotis]
MAKPKLTPLTATARTEFGKGAARRIRRAGDVPAVLYGHGTDPQHVTLPGQETFLALRQANVLLEINSEGAKPIMALPKQVQRNVITNFVEHVDLLIVRADEKVSVEVALIITGEAERGSLVNQDLQSLTVLAPAVAIPEEIEVSIEGLVIGDHITVGDLKLPAGVESQQEGDILVVNITQPTVADLETEDEEGAEGEGAEESAEGSEEA